MGCDGLKERERGGRRGERRIFGCEKGGSISQSPLGHCKCFRFYGVQYEITEVTERRSDLRSTVMKYQALCPMGKARSWETSKRMIAIIQARHYQGLGCQW